MQWVNVSKNIPEIIIFACTFALSIYTFTMCTLACLTISSDPIIKKNIVEVLKNNTLYFDDG